MSTQFFVSRDQDMNYPGSDAIKVLLDAVIAFLGNTGVVKVGSNIFDFVEMLAQAHMGCVIYQLPIFIKKGATPVTETIQLDGRRLERSTEVTALIATYKNGHKVELFFNDASRINRIPSLDEVRNILKATDGASIRVGHKTFDAIKAALKPTYEELEAALLLVATTNALPAKGGADEDIDQYFDIEPYDTPEQTYNKFIAKVRVK
jgi:hypothetical protein